eukprot:4370205-Amphidinium_carterae.1
MSCTRHEQWSCQQAKIGDNSNHSESDKRGHKLYLCDLELSFHAYAPCLGSLEKVVLASLHKQPTIDRAYP